MRWKQIEPGAYDIDLFLELAWVPSNSLKLVAITNPSLYPLTSWSLHLPLSQVAPLLTPIGSCKSRSQEWVARWAYLSSFIRTKNVFILKAQLLWHWSRERCYLICTVNKWLNGDQQFILENEDSAVTLSWTWPPPLLVWTFAPHRIIAGCLCSPLSMVPRAWWCCHNVYILTKARGAVKESRFGLSPTWQKFILKVLCKENGDLSTE